MADASPQFHVRLASSDGDDAESILAAWDSTLPFLAPIGAGEMWGDQPFSQRAGQRQEVIDIINGTTNKFDGGRQFWIAEVHRAEEIVKVGAAMTREVLPGYLTKHVDMGSDSNTMEAILYLEVLIADHRFNKRCRGAGKALIEALAQRARSDGRNVIYVDVWAGNDRKLNTQVWPLAEAGTLLILE